MEQRYKVLLKFFLNQGEKFYIGFRKKAVVDNDRNECIAQTPVSVFVWAFLMLGNFYPTDV